MRGRNSRSAATIAALFNEKFPVGAPVYYFGVRGILDTRKLTKVKGEAFVSKAGTPVCFVEDVRGYVHCDNIAPIENY